MEIYAKNAAKPAAGEPTVDEALLAGIEAKHVTQCVSRPPSVPLTNIDSYRWGSHGTRWWRY